MRQGIRPVSWQLRLGRGLLLGLAMLLLTVVAHSAAHGQLPDASAFALLMPVSLGLSVIAMERPRSTMWFLLYAVGVQGLLHVLLVTASGHTDHHSSLLPSPSMIMAHVSAAALLAIVLSRFDAGLLRWLAYMRTVLFGRPAPAVSFPSNPLPQIPSLPMRGVTFTIAHEISRRGPPESR